MSFLRMCSPPITPKTIRQTPEAEQHFGFISYSDKSTDKNRERELPRTEPNDSNGLVCRSRSPRGDKAELFLFLDSFTVFGGQKHKTRRDVLETRKQLMNLKPLRACTRQRTARHHTKLFINLDQSSECGAHYKTSLRELNYWRGKLINFFDLGMTEGREGSGSQVELRGTLNLLRVG